MVTVRKSKLLPTSATIRPNTYYYEFDVDTVGELPDPYYNNTIVAHGSKATIIANGRQYRINGEGEWCIQRHDASDPILIKKTITENGTYTALDEDVDGYSSVKVDVPEKEITFKNQPTMFSLPANIENELNVIIPSGIETIGENAFRSCTSLKSVIIPNTVNQINQYAFYGCDALNTVSVPGSVLRIYSSAFRECTSLKNVTIGRGAFQIASDCFTGCTSLESITINKAEGSITGAPWGAPNTTQIVWTG